MEPYYSQGTHTWSHVTDDCGNHGIKNAKNMLMVLVHFFQSADVEHRTLRKVSTGNNTIKPYGIFTRR